jgi:DNA-binding PadR family transcriptional regulator
VESFSSRLNYDAALILALHEAKAPLTVDELMMHLKQITGSEQIFKRSVQYRNLQNLVENGFVRKLNIDGKEAYVVHDYADEEAKVLFAIFDFTRVKGRWPNVEEIGLDSGIPTAEAERIALRTSSVTGWRPPKGELDEAPDFVNILELAAWVKLGCGRTGYITSRWEISDIVRARMIAERYPDFVPTIEAKAVDESGEKFAYRMIWNTVTPFNTTIRSSITTTAEKKEFSGCLHNLRITRKPR